MTTRATTKTTPKSARTLRRMALALEYSPRHRWKPMEDELICVLHRWWTRQPQIFSRIFNEHFQSSLSTQKIRARFDYLRLHGPRAFPVYRAVSSVAFDDPEHKYSALRREIEKTALSLKIVLERLRREVFSPLVGRARTSRAPKIRKRYRALVKKASQEEKMSPAHIPTVAPLPTIVPCLGGVPLMTTTELDSLEYLVEAEPPAPRHQSSRTVIHGRDVAPRLAFRVWDNVGNVLFYHDFY
jgi:hypothetical protein